MLRGKQARYFRMDRRDRSAQRGKGLSYDNVGREVVVLLSAMMLCHQARANSST